MDLRRPNVSTMVASWTTAIWHWLTHTMRAVIQIEEEKPYRPEAYYMRGPGPKWREKHAQTRGSRLR